MGFVYQITNIQNGKFYIGSTVNEKRRKSVHFSKLRKNKHCNCHLQASWNKYGEESFIFKIVDVCCGNYTDLLALEQKWIDQTNACQFGYNINPLVLQPPINKGIKKPKSGKRIFGRLKNPEGKFVEFFGIREFSRKNNLSHVCVSLMIKGKMGQHRGWKTTVRKSNTKKYIPTQSHRENLSKAMIGIKRSKEICEKIRKSHIGKKHSEETKKKISEARKKFHRQSLAVV